MTNKFEPSRILVNFLRANLTDINSARVGEWIYADFPRVKNLGDKSFPRVGLTLINEFSEPVGIFDDTMFDTIQFQIDIVAKKGNLYSITTTDEAIGTIANSPRIYFTHIPTTITNIKHNGTAFGTITAKDTDDDFTAPASLAAGTVEWSKSTGNLNFSSADLTSYAAQAITSTSIAGFEGARACDYIARDIVNKMRTSWRNDSDFKPLFYPIKLNNVPLPFDEEVGLFRRTLEYEVRMYNSMEGL